MFHQPHTLAEALRLRSDLGSAVTVINGGTDVVVAMNHGDLRPAQFLDLSRVDELRTIERDNGTVLMGAGVTFAQLGKLHWRGLREASLSVAGPAIRSRATIGGNIVSASPAGDGAVVLVALGAEVELTSADRGPRWLPLRDFFVAYRQTALAGDELVTRFRVPWNPMSRWYKIGKRGAVNISIVCCCVARNPDGSYGIALGCVAPFPVAAWRAEALLGESELTPVLIEQAGQIVSEEVSPIDDQRGSADYRRAMCAVLARRLLRSLASGDGKGDADA